MTSRGSPARPARIATWLISLFVLDNQAEPIEGDLLEEFSAIASRTNPAAARRWYWKQSLKTSAHLAWISLRSAPWQIAFTTLAGFSILWYVENQLGLPTHLVCAAIDRYSSFYMNHFSIWQFCLNYGIPAVSWILVVLVGCLIALVARGREIVATATLGLFQFLTAPLLTYLLLFAYRALSGHVLISAGPAYIPITVSVIYRSQGVGALVLFIISPVTTVLSPIVGGMLVRKLRQSAARTPAAA
jgi:hypothetical protein